MLHCSIEYDCTNVNTYTGLLVGYNGHLWRNWTQWGYPSDLRFLSNAYDGSVSVKGCKLHLCFCCRFRLCLRALVVTAILRLCTVATITLRQFNLMDSRWCPRAMLTRQEHQPHQSKGSSSSKGSRSAVVSTVQLKTLS